MWIKLLQYYVFKQQRTNWFQFAYKHSLQLRKYCEIPSVGRLHLG